MNARIELTEFEAERFTVELKQTLNRLKSPVVEAMRDRAYEIVLSNFGIAGPDRPWPWAPLAESTKRAYRRRKPPVTREYASLELTGALKASLKKEPVRDGAASVSMDDAEVPYATAHHYGTKNMPARRVFPIRRDDSVTDWTREQVKQAAVKELLRLLNE
jgi:phage gpG-like protein